jgi:hypothetical protein
MLVRLFSFIRRIGSTVHDVTDDSVFTGWSAYDPQIDTTDIGAGSALANEHGRAGVTVIVGRAACQGNDCGQ